MKITDALLGGFFLLLGALMLWQASLFPTFASQPYGAAFLPSILASGFILAGALLLVRDLRLRRALAKGDTGQGDDSNPFFAWNTDLKHGGAPALLAVLGNVLAHIFLTPIIGFLPVSIVGLTLLFLILRLRPWVAIAIAIATSLVCWWLFVGLLRVPLPRGILDGVL
ncbi:tripartite tricarboxylate transporter TctB family protein [Pseudooceanicola algae]|uniref:DUF1468 domain-containing protein n=1 Tax=Pseudooceanicola algae TaxID=1537215 RepID=A0A418SCS9_9RHOB|nr:tripartite tricarboxylate transporter TctB family protein [Pseudooceanicola algae]QPM92403.1 hypothetical protein PSAL_036670 [Pseudooceanicola algae]